MRETIKRRGNHAVLRLPVSVMDAAHLQMGSAVDMYVENGCIVITALRPGEYILEALLAGITAENLHTEIDL